MSSPAATPLVFGFAVGAGVTAGVVGVLAWRRRTTPGGAPLVALELSILAWILAETMTVLVEGVGATVFWMRVVQGAVALTVLSWVLFAAEYTGRGWLLGPAALGALAVQPVLFAWLVWTNGAHGLVWAEVAPAATVTGVAVVEHGPAFWGNLAYTFLVLAAGTGMLVNASLSSSGGRRWRTAAIVGGAAVPGVVSLLEPIGVQPIPGLDLTPYASVVPGLAFVWALEDRDLLDVPPILPSVDHDAIVGEVDDGVVVVDGDLRVVECNAAALSVASTDAAEGRRFDEVFPDLAGVVDGTALREGRREEVAVQDGPRERYVELQVSPIRRGSHAQGAVVTLHEVTERVIRDQRLDVLNRVLRHNVRQETNVILGHSQIIESSAEADVGEHTSVMKGAARNLAEWSNQARRIERVLERATADRDRIDTGSAVESAVESVRDTYPGARIGVDVDVAGEALAHGSLREAVHEVIENAVEHNDATDPEIRVGVDADDEWVQISVADDGPGIPPEERAVFDRGRETPLEHGSGLGLWLVKWILYASGGEIEFEDNDPRGTVVRMRVPRAGAATDDDAGESRQAPA